MFGYCLTLIGQCDKVDDEDPNKEAVEKANESKKAEARKLLAAVLGKGEHPLSFQAAGGVLPVLRARTGIEEDRKAPDKRLAKLARQLPVAPWFEATYGVAIGSLAAIVGEAGDLSNYPNPAKLVKRFGLAPYNGKAYSSWKKLKGKPGALSGIEWERAGYNPQRRSVMWNIGNGLIGGMGNGPRPTIGEDVEAREDWSSYQKMFVKELRRIADLYPEHDRLPTKEGKESFSKHAAARAKCKVERQFLIDLWVEWRRANGDAVSMERLPAASIPIAA